MHIESHWLSICDSLYVGSSLQHTATHCNTLQHTATHCNTLTLYMRLSICRLVFSDGRAPTLYTPYTKTFCQAISGKDVPDIAWQNVPRLCIRAWQNVRRVFLYTDSIYVSCQWQMRHDFVYIGSVYVYVYTSFYIQTLSMCLVIHDWARLSVCRHRLCICRQMMHDFLLIGSVYVYVCTAFYIQARHGFVYIGSIYVSRLYI